MVGYLFPSPNTPDLAMGMYGLSSERYFGEEGF